MAGLEPKCYMCNKPLPHSPGVRAPGLCECDERTSAAKREPELFLVDGSEIIASVDPMGVDDDQILRPIFINQDSECIYLTIADARRLNEFLTEAIPFLEERIFEH